MRDSISCARLGARQGEHVAHQPVELVEAAQQRCGSVVAAALVGFAVQQFDLRAQDSERRPQLVRGIGDEIALALERPLEPLEHVVERPGQHAHLTAGGDRAGAFGKVACGRGRRHGRDPPQRCSDQRCESHSRHRRQQHRQYADNRECTQEARLDCACATGVSGFPMRNVPTRRLSK